MDVRRIGGRQTFSLVIAVAAILALAPAAASAATTTETFDVGPVNVGGYEVQQSVRGAPHPDFGSQSSGFITRMEVDVVDADGNPIPIQRLMLHHIVFANLARPDETCSSITGFDSYVNSGLARERFFAAGEERAKMVLPDGYGYPVHENDPWGLLYMFMNHRSVVDEAYIRYTVTTMSGSDAAQLKPVTPYWLDVVNCHADPIYNVPGNKQPGSSHTRSADFVIPEDGRVVAGGGHVHGGARELTLTQPDCGDRELFASMPTWGTPEHPFYNVRPVLHEPGPINMTAFTSETGFPVAAGQRLRLNSIYDNSLPHTRVMGIEVAYISHEGPVDSCGALPSDIQTLGSSLPGRPGPIPYRIPLTGIDQKTGQAVKIKNPPGKLEDRKSGSELLVGDRFFLEPNVRIRKNARLRWRFATQELHNVTLANGPVGIGSDNLNGDRTFERRFTKKGTYRFFCGLHPVDMTQRVVVTGRKRK